MALIRCRECGQVISDKAAKCPRCGCPSMSEQTQLGPYDTPSNTGGYQGGYQRGYQGGGGSSNNNNWLYAIIAVLLAVIAGGAFWWYNSAKKEQKIQQNTEQVANKDENTTSKDTGTVQQNKTNTTPAGEQEVKPKTDQTPPPVTPPPVSPVTYLLSGVLYGDEVDNVAFNLRSNGSSSVSGVFTNYSINVSFNVSGTLTNSQLSLRSVGHGKWRFNASKYGGSYQGTASNGSVSYSFEVQ